MWEKHNLTESPDEGQSWDVIAVINEDGEIFRFDDFYELDADRLVVYLNTIERLKEYMAFLKEEYMLEPDTKLTDSAQDLKRGLLIIDKAEKFERLKVSFPAILQAIKDASLFHAIKDPQSHATRDMVAVYRGLRRELAALFGEIEAAQRVVAKNAPTEKPKERNPTDER